MSTLGAQQVFDSYAERYDAWYDTAAGRALLASEVECIRPLVEPFPRPYLEVGVGTGRFAQALGIEYGLDPSLLALERAQRRGVQAMLAAWESIPFKDACFGAVLMAFTLCFVRDPNLVLQEVHRVLVPTGGLILGLLLKGTPWADSYARRGAAGHPLYRTAHFYAKEDVEALLRQSGFCIKGYRSTLFQRPGLEVYQEERPEDGYIPGAGFVAVVAVRTEARG